MKSLEDSQSDVDLRSAEKEGVWSAGEAEGLNLKCCGADGEGNRVWTGRRKNGEGEACKMSTSKNRETVRRREETP